MSLRTEAWYRNRYLGTATGWWRSFVNCHRLILQELFNMVLTEERTDEAMIVRYVFNATPEATISGKEGETECNDLSFVFYPFSTCPLFLDLHLCHLAGIA